MKSTQTSNYLLHYSGNPKNHPKIKTFNSLYYASGVARVGVRGVGKLRDAGEDIKDGERQKPNPHIIIVSISNSL